MDYILSYFIYSIRYLKGTKSLERLNQLATIEK